MRKMNEKQFDAMMNELLEAFYYELLRDDIKCPHLISSVAFYEGYHIHRTYNTTLVIGYIFITYDVVGQQIELFDARPDEENNGNWFEWWEIKDYNKFELAFRIRKSLEKHGIL